MDVPDFIYPPLLRMRTLRFSVPKAAQGVRGGAGTTTQISWLQGHGLEVSEAARTAASGDRWTSRLFFHWWPRSRERLRGGAGKLTSA